MLKYTGGGYGGALPDIPARDLTDEEVEKLGGVDYLLLTGLYVQPDDPKPAISRRSAKPIKEGDS